VINNHPLPSDSDKNPFYVSDLVVLAVSVAATFAGSSFLLSRFDGFFPP
jgi:hypothetical protein